MNIKQLTQAQRKRLGYYAWAGPLFGLALVNIAFLIFVLFEMLTSNSPASLTLKDVFQFFLFWGSVNLYGVFMCYLIGLLPAVITGAVAVRCKYKKDEAICAALVGASPYVALYIVGIAIDGFDTDWGAWLIVAPIGAIAGALCACTRRTSADQKPPVISSTQQPI